MDTITKSPNQRPQRQPLWIRLRTTLRLPTMDWIVGATDPLTLRKRLRPHENKIAGIPLAWYCCGLLLFLIHALFFHGSETWNTIYYIWDKVKDALFITTICYLYKPLRRAYVCAFIYSIIRILWEIILITKPRLSPNESGIVNALLLAMIIGISYLTIHDLIEQWERK